MAKCLNKLEIEGTLCNIILCPVFYLHYIYTAFRFKSDTFLPKGLKIQRANHIATTLSYAIFLMYTLNKHKESFRSLGWLEYFAQHYYKS